MRSSFQATSGLYGPSMSGRIIVGTSSWADPGFVKEWYPPKMAARERLPWYAQRFEGVELNSLPPDLRDGVETTARGRVRLTPELETGLAKRLVEETSPLAEAGKLGAYLLQLTPAFGPGRHELEELDRVVEAFAPHKVAVELRHRGWVREKRRDETLAWFSERGIAFVCVDAPPGDEIPIMPSDLDAVTRDDLAYLRLHGRNAEGYLHGKSVAERFAWRYDDEELDEIAGRAHAMAEQAAEVHVAFNNNRGDDAPTAAQRFRALLGHRAVDQVQEAAELLGPVARRHVGDHLAGGDIERGVEVRRAVAHVVVGVALGHPRHQRQDRRRAIERLDLRLLVDAHDDRGVGRVEIEPDDVAHLVDEQRVG